MHLPKANLFAYILAGVAGLLFIVLAAMNAFGSWMMSAICGFAGVIALISTGMTLMEYWKKAKEKDHGQQK